MKRYFKQRLLGHRGFSWATAMNYMGFIPKFINFICSLEPEWNDLTELSREHVLRYIEQVHYHAKVNLKDLISNINRRYFRENKQIKSKKDVFNHFHCGSKGICATFEWMNRGIC